jgi:hypothetical protein
MNALAQDKRNALNKAVFLLRAKARCKGQAFSCFLDEQPTELVPGAARKGLSSPTDEAELVVNASFHYQRESNPPAKMIQSAVPLDSFLGGYPIAWVEDAGTGIWMPFWARGEWVEALESLQPGLPPPSELPPAARQTLKMANILVPRGYERDRRVQWEKTCRDGQAQTQTDGYVFLRDLIHPLQIGAMRRYYRGLVEVGDLPVGDSQVSERYRLHSEVLASFVHPQLTDLVSRLAGEAVKPSYVYFASYKPGSDLPRHVDREQCEYSLSLLVDYAPDPDGPCGWPLYLEDPRAPEMRVAADLALGDAVFYRGRELVHHRDALPDDHQSTSLFLHFVREDFGGDLF